MAEQNTLVAGVGDEVVLFGAFLLLSFCMLIYFTRRRGTRGNQHPDQPGEGRDQHGRSDTASDGQPQGGVRDHTQRPVAEESTSQAPQGRTDGAQLRSRFHGGLPSESQDATAESGLGEGRSEGGEPRGEGPQPAGTGSGGRDPREGPRRGDEISVRLLQPESSTSISVSPSTTLGEIRSTYFQEQLAEGRPVRFIYRGSVLEDDLLSLEQLGIGDNSALHVHVGRPRPRDGTGEQGEEDFLDLSRLFVPLFGVVLGVVWVCLLMYPYVFTFVTKLMLFCLSLGYVYLAYVTTRT